MYCVPCEAKDQFKVEFSLFLIKQSLENDDEFKNIEEKSYEETKKFLRTKYGKVQKYITRANSHAYFQEGIVVKSDYKSEVLRKEGNVEFVKGEFFEALKYYYKAVAFAETGEKLALCYGNISALHFRAGNIESCLTSINHAREYPLKDNILQKLSKREEECSALLRKKKRIEYAKAFPLSYTPNPKNPKIVNCIGRGPNGGVIATRNLKMGDVIAVTNPIVNGCNRRADYNTCSNCWKKMSDTDIFACEGCVHIVYCSSKCKMENFEFHKIVCYSNDLIFIELMALDFAFKVLSAGFNIDSEEFQNSNITCFDWEGENFKNQTKVAFSMKTGADWDLYSKFIMLNSYFLLLKKLKKNDVFNSLISNFENGEALFFKTYWKAFKVIKVNSISPETALVLEEDLTITSFDVLMGHFNHSCAPNVYIFRNDKSDVSHYMVLDDVKSGEELFISYE